MKRIIYYTLFIVAGLLQSCTNEVDDLFDQSAQLRMNAELQAVQELLVSPEYGWVLEYYPSQIQAYGGYTMTLKFDREHVTAACFELTGDPAETYSSLYSLKSDMGPTLNFDTYNDILHYFADPDNSGGAGLGKGYEGDYEFVIMSHTEEEIILQGKKTKNLMRMTRLTEPSETYLTALGTIYDSFYSTMGIASYDGTINGQPVKLSLPSNNHMQIETQNDTITTAFNFTQSGIHFYEPVEIGGTTILGLNWSTTEQTFQVDGVSFTPVHDPVFDRYIRYTGDYIMEYNYGSTLRQVPITLSTQSYTPSAKTYSVDGLPFPLVINYNESLDLMEILTANYGTYYVAVWEVIGNGTLSWGAGYGLIGEPRTDPETGEEYYEFVDNGVWGSYVARALILWSASGEYRGFGGDTRFQYIKFYRR